MRPNAEGSGRLSGVAREPGISRSVGRYEILREVGRGGMAVVFLARQTELDRLVALKELAAFQASDPTVLRRFLSESRLAGSLTHPNIVTVHDYFEHDRTPYISMEYLERGSLRPYVGRMTLAQVMGVLEGLLAGLEHAASRQIVHRDLKPENVMVSSEGRVKITDFGISKARDRLTTRGLGTAPGRTVGTPAYMAPEQAAASELGPWTDLYSLGVMAYEMLVGRVPFHATETPVAILFKHVNEPVPSPRSVNPDLDEGLAEWVERLLQKRPGDRYSDAAEAWDDLEERVIAVLGPRWRRDARLAEAGPAGQTPDPLPPAFSESVETPESGSAEGRAGTGRRSNTDADMEFESFHWTSPGAAEPGLVTPSPPGPWTPPPGPAATPVDRLPSLTEDPQPEPDKADPQQSARFPGLEATLAPVPEEPSIESVTQRPERRRRISSFAVAAIAGIVAAAAGFLMAHSGGAAESRAAPLTSSAGNSTFELRFPGSWLRLETIPKLPGMELQQPLAVGPRGRAAGKVVTGMVDAQGPSLLPASLKLARPLPSPVAVDLGELQALRYRAVSLTGRRQRVTLYAAPTDAGVATLACFAAGEECERVATTLRLPRGEAFTLGSNNRYARELNVAFARIRAERKRYAARLRSAETAAGQARGADGLGSGYLKAARMLSRVKTSPADADANEAIATALRRVGVAYGRLAKAARAGNRSAYSRAANEVRRGTRELDRGVSSLRKLGYRVG